MRKLTRWPLAPFLLGIYPAIHLYAVNADRMSWMAFRGPFIDTAVGTCILTILLMLMLRSATRGALAASTLFFLYYFFHSGQTVLLPSTTEGFWFPVSQIVLFLAVVAGMVAVVRLARRERD